MQTMDADQSPRRQRQRKDITKQLQEYDLKVK